MKANELRIGNLVWVNLSNEVYEVLYLDDTEIGLMNRLDRIKDISIEKVFPIPITEELLAKFGFEKHGEFGEYYRIFNKGLIIDIEDTNNEFIVWVRIGDDILKPLLEVGYPIAYIQYVHQLQNLYFALTGEELTLSK